VRRGRAVALAALAVAVAAPGSAQAAWTQPDASVGGNPAVGPFVGVADNGEAIAQWHQPRGVYVSIRPEGGQFARPVRIGGPAALSYMTVGANGDAIAVWRARRRGNPVYMSIRSPFGRFGRPRLVARRTASFPLAAIDGGGQFAVVWTQGRALRRVIRIADGRSGRIQRRRTLSRPGATSPVIDMGDLGNVGVAWIQGTQRGRRGRVLVRTARRIGGSFRAAERLSPRGQSTGSPRIAMPAFGAGMVAWRAGRVRSSQVWARDTGGAAPAVRLSDRREPAGDPVVGASAGGEATVAWIRGPRDTQGLFNGRVMQATRAENEEEFGRATQLDGNDGSSYLPRIAVNELRDAIVLWTSYDSTDAFAQFSAFRPAGADAFGAPEVASSSGNDALNGDVGLDRAGNAVAAWVDIDEAEIRAAFRPAGP
jgi:hypothetical protein